MLNDQNFMKIIFRHPVVVYYLTAVESWSDYGQFSRNIN